MVPPVPANAPAFVKDVLGMMIANRGDDLPVSAMPCDGTFPTGTTQYEKRSIAQDIPIWDPKICIQCGLCSLACPHATIRMKAFDPALLAGRPEGFKSADWQGQGVSRAGSSPCRWPRTIAPAAACASTSARPRTRRVAKHKAIDMEPKLQHLDARAGELTTSSSPLPDVDRTQGQGRHDQGLAVAAAAVRVLRGLRRLRRNALRQAAHAVLRRPHVDRQRHRLLVDLRRQSALHALHGQPATAAGPAWSNSLFEDCAEFGLGFRLAIDQQIDYARELLRRLVGQLGDELVGGLIEQQAGDRRGDRRSSGPRGRVAQAARGDRQRRTPKNLLASADYLIRKSVWSFGGDGWAYDIGFGGLDHVFASGRDVNILVLDTEVYSNTGGQASKSTLRGAVAKFAAGGKPGRKKDLGMIAMSYGNVFVGQISLGANPMHAIRPSARPSRTAARRC